MGANMAISLATPGRPRRAVVVRRMCGPLKGLRAISLAARYVIAAVGCGR